MYTHFESKIQFVYEKLFVLRLFLKSVHLDLISLYVHPHIITLFSLITDEVRMTAILRLNVGYNS